MKQNKAPIWFTSYMDEHNSQLNKRLDRMESKIDENSENIKKMMNTPTMKKELNQ